MGRKVQQQRRWSYLFFNIISTDKTISVCDVEPFDGAKDFGDRNSLFWVFARCDFSTCRNSGQIASPVGFLDDGCGHWAGKVAVC